MLEDYDSLCLDTLLLPLVSVLFDKTGLVSRSRPFPFYYVEEGRVWPTAIELPVLAFTQGRVSVNWFEVSRQPFPPPLIKGKGSATRD